MKVIVVMPTYNEAKNIGRMLDVLVKEEIPRVKNHKVEVLVVDSHSPDGTAKIVREKMKKYRAIHLLETDKGGLGADYVKGMKYAIKEMEADTVIEFDADFQHDPKDIKRLIAGMDETGADQVIGSRYVAGGGTPKAWGWNRKAMSFFGGLFARVVLLINIHDMTSGFKLTRTNYLKKVDLDNLLSRSYAYKLHITHDIARMGAKVVEVPIKFYERKEGTSKISRKDLIDSFMVVARLRLRDSKRFVKFGIVGFVGYTINALGLKFFAQSSITLSLANTFAHLDNYPGLGVAAEPSAWAGAFGAELAIMSNFLFNNFWTFAAKRITNPVQFLIKFLQFNLSSIAAVIVQFLVIGAAVKMFGDTEKVRQFSLVAAIIFIIVPLNYTIYNVFIWKTWKLPRMQKLTV
ncbi:MAG: glycosyltransferase family 2 protein [Candidatus Blackburnbacteria bacterium]|nr:glycosyltransferase family 2 protein [Candidatus Blackburnbacteria bacterium]